MGQVALRRREDRTALFRLRPQLLDLAPEDPTEQHEEYTHTDDDEQGEPRMRGLVAETDIEGAGNTQKHVEVDERPGEGEEDLLHEIRRDRSADRAARDDGHEHEQRHERADVRRQEAVHRHAYRIGGDDRPQLDLPRVGHAQDAVVREPGEDRLAGLEGKGPDDVPGIGVPDVLDLVPEVAQPAANVDTKQLEHEPEDRQAHQPGDHLSDALPPWRAHLDRGLDCAVHQVDPDAATTTWVMIRRTRRRFEAGSGTTDAGIAWALTQEVSHRGAAAQILPSVVSVDQRS